VSTMFPKFFGVPQQAVRMGKMKSLSGTAYKLYVTLCHESERYSTRERTYTTKALITLMGGSPNAHKKARDELIRAELVQVEQMGTEGFVYHFCNPETGKPWPLSPTEKVVYQPKNAPPIAITQDVSRFKPPEIDDAGTSFNYGCGKVAVDAFRAPPPEVANLPPIWT